MKNSRVEKKKTIAISRTPYRINLAGATDLIPYVRRFGGEAFSGAIDKYVTIVVQKRSDGKIVFHNALATEEVSDADRIKNPHVRAVLSHVGIRTNLDIVSFTDAPLASGLGSSGAFVVGLLNALWAFEGRRKEPRDLAEEAAHVEIKLLNSPIGKHDQYLASYGGICSLSFFRDGNVKVEKIFFSGREKREFERLFLLLHSGMSGPTSATLGPVHRKLQAMHPETVSAMHTFRDMSSRLKQSVLQKDFISFGRDMGDFWEQEKRTFSNSNRRIDTLISTGKRAGAISGLVMGAGGGGFLYLVCPNSAVKSRVSKVLARMGAVEYPFSFVEEGSKIIFSQ